MDTYFAEAAAMDGDEDVPDMSEDLFCGSNDFTESKKREAKGSCLKIEGQDGYVFKSYSINPHDVADAMLPACSSMLDKDSLPSCFHLTSQVDKRLETCDSDSDSSDTDTEEHTESDKFENGSGSSEHVRDDIDDANGMEDETQYDERLAFGGSIGPFLPRDVDDYSNLFGGYTSTLYDVAMDAVTQSLLSSMRSQANPRKKSPAWNHFCISPRDNTKAICLYCMKEFSRGKNEKDLSTSCLMRHVRRAHPTVLVQDGDASLHNLPSFFASSLIPPSPSSPKNGDFNSLLAFGSKDTSPSTSSAECSDPSPKEVLPKVEPNLEPYASADSVCDPLADLHSSDNNLEDLSDEVPVPPSGTPKRSSSRRRSAVWKHFYLSPADNSKAVCIHCMNEFSRGKNGKDLGTSCLIRHMWRAHREVVIEENGQGNHIPPPYTNPPSLSRTHLQDSLDIKKEPALLSSPETESDDLPHSMEDSIDIKKECEELLHLSAHGSSLNLSFQTQGDDTPLTSSPCDLSEGPSFKQDHSVFQQNKKIMKRVKSEVWHHFIVSPVDQLKALCRYCPCVISRGKRGDFGTSCLMRHLMRRHPDVLKNQKSTDKELFSHPYINLPTTNAVSAKEADAPHVDKKPPHLPVFGKKTSKLWNHFSISPTDPTKVVCLHCSRTISRGKKTTNLGTSCLYRHMQRFHRHFLEGRNTISGNVPSATIRVKQEVMDTADYQAEQNCERFDEHHPVAKKITKLIAEMLALDLQPAAVVENTGLTRLLEFLQPQYALPPSSYFTSTAIPDMYEKVKGVLLTHLKEAEAGVVHFTTSIWVSSQTKEYLTLTAHWATYESNVRPQGQDCHCSALLSVSQIDHDMHDIPKQLEYLWDSWITSTGLRKGFTVTNNSTIRHTLDAHGHATLQCFGHVIDLIISEAIKSQRMVQNVLSIARKLCERVHRSPQAKERLVELQRAHQLPENQLIQDVPSKWRTSFFMLERLVEQKTAIDEMSVECDFREIISGDQWEVLLSVCNALKPFEVACREMSTRTATLGQVIPLVHILNRKIDLLFDETVGIDNMLRSLKEAMVTRLSAVLRDPQYTWATMLDPRYKTSLFTEEEAERCKLDLIQELDLSSTTSINSLLPNGYGEDPDSNKNLWSMVTDFRQKIKTEERSSELEVLEYLEEDILDQSCDPMDYWNLKKFLWPDLAKIAARYVGCPPSIVAADALFSTASCALNQARPTMDNMEGLLFLKVNLPLICFQY
ncbi:zinc finger BED domain-containing protein 4 [Austrofundulus limnaeus]|uniref:Zinc finger BED domain-containing protein 4 n=1 Tax=Austrofundulus limnaeus TaxID=52670 RepID=A0A2I4BQK5_AUSLI|nr:PREDICTED: zinc finger BED domain-containing protein 4 [Austrofundulus limnaeus]